MNSKKKYIISAGIILLFLTFILILQNRLLKVIISVDGTDKVVYHKKMTVGALLEKENIKHDADSFISEPVDSEIENLMKITVKNPKSYVFKIGSNFLHTKSFGTTIYEIAEDSGLTLDEDDYTEPLTLAELEEGQVIEIFKVHKYTESMTALIPFQTTKVNNKNLESGKTRIAQAGKYGTKEKIYSYRTVNGIIVDKILEDEKFIEPPSNEVVETGTKPKVVASRSGSHDILATPKVKLEAVDGALSDGTSYKAVLNMTATAYDNTPEQNGGWTVTKMGTPLRRGVVAVDPTVIPLGTRVYVQSLDGSPDYGYASAEDIGSAIKGNRIDLCFDNGKARLFGIKNVKVYILD